MEEGGREEDRISDLPDFLVHHILSFLPSTKEAIKTTVLSKRWQNQWTRVPALIFRSTDTTDFKFESFVDKILILHDCSKIVKFQLSYPNPRHDCKNWLTEKILFATRKHVEELILNVECSYCHYGLPQFLYDNASLVKLETRMCFFYGIVKWRSLKILKIKEAYFYEKMIEYVVSGCPVLELLELIRCTYVCKRLLIASKSLKSVCLDQIMRFPAVVEISCPNLEELKLFSCEGASEFKFRDLPSWVCASVYYWKQCNKTLAMDVLNKLQHVRELKLGHSFIKVGVWTSDRYFINKCSCLTVDYPYVNDDFCGIAYVLRDSPLLEKLVIKLLPEERNHQNGFGDDFHDWINDLGEGYWSSDRFFCDCLMSKLKKVKIIGLCERDYGYKSVLRFIQFLVRNARVLQKLIVILSSEDSGTVTYFMSDISQRLSSLSRASPHATIELCSTELGISIYM